MGERWYLKAVLSGPKVGALTLFPAARPAGSCCKADSRGTIQGRCWKRGPSDEVPTSKEVTQNDYKVVQTSVDSCSRLQCGGPCPGGALGVKSQGEENTWAFPKFSCPWFDVS